MPFVGVEGWYVLTDYPLNRAEFGELADSGKIAAYIPGVSSTICCCHDSTQQVHCPYWAKEPVPDLLVTTALDHLTRKVKALRKNLQEAVATKNKNQEGLQGEKLMAHPQLSKQARACP